jgi:hypothetical protein
VSEIDRCNGVRINDRHCCKDTSCPLYSSCDRIALNPQRN